MSVEVVDCGRDDEPDRVGCRAGPYEGLVDGAGPTGPPFLADSTGQVGLRIDVNEQNSPASQSQRRRQVDDGRRLAHTALLIGDRHNSSHDSPMYKHHVVRRPTIGRMPK